MRRNSARKIGVSHILQLIKYAPVWPIKFVLMQQRARRHLNDIEDGDVIVIKLVIVCIWTINVPGHHTSLSLALSLCTSLQ